MVYKDEEIEVMSAAEAMWSKALENTGKRLEQYPMDLKRLQEAVIIDTAFKDLCEKKMKEASK